MEKDIYNRNLPHIQPRDGVFFVTFRLAGSLPSMVIEQLLFEREKLRKTVLHSDNAKNTLYQKDFLFEKYDELLDNPLEGNKWLENKHIAEVLQEAICFGDNKDYKLICYSIMPNHVHIILYKCEKPLYRILQSLKRHTSRKANVILGRRGEFWHKESYDNLIRDRNDLVTKINYVLQNPVKVGIAGRWEDHSFTWCRETFFKYLI